MRKITKNTLEPTKNLLWSLVSPDGDVVFNLLRDDEALASLLLVTGECSDDWLDDFFICDKCLLVLIVGGASLRCSDDTLLLAVLEMLRWLIWLNKRKVITIILSKEKNVCVYNVL